MATKVDIANWALALLGQGTISSLSGTEEAAQKANLFIDSCIDEVLRAYPWKRAKKRASLTADATAPAFEYSYRYALPNDCLRVLRGEEITSIFKVEGQYILSDDDTCKILYIARITVNEMDSLCRYAVAAKLAAKLAFPLTNSTSLADAMMNVYKDAILEANMIDAQEGTPDDIDVSTWLDARI